MSPKFIKEFKKSQACKECDGRPPKGRQFCTDHLSKAREVWMLWSIIRRKSGRCSYCNRVVDVKGTIRCRIHRAYNIQKCRAWHALHGKAAAARAYKKQAAYITACRAQGDTRTKTQLLAERGLLRKQRRDALFVTLSAKYPHIVARTRGTTRRRPIAARPLQEYVTPPSQLVDSIK